MIDNNMSRQQLQDNPILFETPKIKVGVFKKKALYHKNLDQEIEEARTKLRDYEDNL
jgi:hypothetical protein